MKHKLYKLTVPKAMEGHVFVDDVAVCYALSKVSAVRKFKRLYNYSTRFLFNNVREVHFNKWDVAILTSY
jgi:hypothetical protein